ncbi:hypothetical protein NPA07_03370 [Mycoplasmopsis caviae]|uniref:Uncharacterized protein n=1 Tax=Mycoplasmopsis caviae TaxID=55603 RepID=A0A3P8KXG7_9BACT|nr:hypothetical protein [Mycoplasmopsis caviae]UUD34837.1 hypothetical protein NPA07_03370 [Mycoplasmopsis caviae]VDR42307.1 Uncharacterised protein [Mycoplasmopsis caviae]
MSVWANKLLDNEEIKTKFISEAQIQSSIWKSKNDFYFWDAINNKKYLKFGSDIVNQILKWKINLSFRVYELLLNSKLSFFVFCFLLKSGAKKKFINIDFLLEHFSRTSLRVAIENLAKKELIFIDNFGNVKINKTFLNLKKERYLKLNHPFHWKKVFIFSLRSLENLLLIEWKSKSIKGKKFSISKNSTIVLQNNFFKRMSKTSIYKMLKQYAEFLDVDYKKLFNTKAKVKKLKDNKHIRKLTSKYFMKVRTLQVNIVASYIF